MATAKVFPSSGTLWPITIEPDGSVDPTNQYMQIGPYDSVSFQNTANYPVNITFTSDFDPINDLQPGATSEPLGGTSELNVTLNYTVANGNSLAPTGGPYALQAGTGALRILIAGDHPSPSPAVIPHGGQIQFNDTSVVFDIKWQEGGSPVVAWSPQPSIVQRGMNNPQTALPSSAGKTFTYTLLVGTAVRGGGTVTVGS